MLIAVDFDGTLSKYIYPDLGVGEEILIDLLPFIKECYGDFVNIETVTKFFITTVSTVEIVKYWKSKGHQLILWTCRENKLFGPNDSLDEAVAWCKKRKLKFDYINSNHTQAANSRKVIADRYIDDKAQDILSYDTWNMNKWLIPETTYGESFSK
jgi:hypothetical protein